MSIATTTYYSFTRVRDMSPSAKDWATTDGNFEAIALVLKALEQHRHNAAAPITYPGYHVTTPLNPTLTEQTSGGILAPGISVGVRLSYLDALGLETETGAETTLTLAGAAARPLTPLLVSKQVANPGLGGGTYIYALTKKKGSGETTISDVLVVDIPYDTTYSVTLMFDAINTYTDGTVSLNLYRSTGLNSSFQLITNITSTAATQFTDTNSIAAGNQNVQPPTSSTFDSSRKMRISWAAFTHPANAAKLRVYVTQATGIWGEQSLLKEIDLTAGPATFVDYLGNETLLPGSPKSSSQIPTGAPKINLATEATGAPVLTAHMNFAGFQAQNMVLHSTTSPSTTNGTVYYDTSIPTVRARINGAWVNWGTTTASAYTHPAEEVGGHVAQNIKFSAGSAVTAKTIFDSLRDASGNPKQVTSCVKSIGTTFAPNTSLTTPTQIPEMIASITPTFAGQWAEATFTGMFVGNTPGMHVIFMIELDGANQTETTSAIYVTGPQGYLRVTIPLLVGLSPVAAHQFKVLWWVDTGTATALETWRSLSVKLVF